MSSRAETTAAPTLTDPSPKRKPGRPKGSKDKRPRKNALKAAQQLAPARRAPKQPQRPAYGGLQINARWPDSALALLDAYRESHAIDTRGEAMRLAALSWIGRWERLRHQEPPAPVPEAPAPFLQRLRLAWRILRGSVRVRVL